MRYKKIVSGLLACAMAVASLFTGSVSAVQAETTADPAPVVTYNFDGSEEGSSGSLGEGVEVLAEGTGSALTPYAGMNNANDFVVGRSGNTNTTTVKFKDSTVTKTKKTFVTVSKGNGKELAVDYDFANSTGVVLTDKAGNHNATIHGGVSFANGAMILKNSAYVDLPKSIMDDLDDKEKFTIEVEFTKSADDLNAWLFCLGSKPKDTGTNYMFLSPNFGGSTLRAGIKNASDEKLFRTSIMTTTDKTYTVNMVFDHGKITFYWNGIQIMGDNGTELNSGFSIVDDVITPGCEGNILGFIGKSCWKNDAYFQGTISKFKIYNKVMTDEEIQGAFSDTFNKLFQKELKIIGSNSSENDIRYNLSLPSTYEEIPITWESSKPEVISQKGVVKNPAAATDVKLTATVKSGLLEGRAEFNLKVLPADKTKLDAAVTKAKAELDNKYRSEASKAEIQKLIDQADKIAHQTEIDNLVKSIEKAAAKPAYSDLYKDPFTEIMGDQLVKADISIAPKGTASVLNNLAAIPDSVKDIVTVSYKSENTNIADVDHTGKVTGKSVGNTVICTIVTAKYDDFAMEYQTLVKVDVDMKGVQVKAGKTTVAKGKTTTVTVTAPANVNEIGKMVTYSAKGAVSVSKAGKVKAVKGGKGTVIVKISVAGKNIVRKVNINVPYITGSSHAKVKKSIKLKVVGIKGKVKWSLNKRGKKLATLKNGKLKAKKKAGSVKVTAKVGKTTMTKDIKIKK